MKPTSFVLPLVLLASLAAVRDAAATDRARHERADVKPIKKGGQVVGMRVQLVLRPYDYSRKFTLARIGIAPVSVVKPAGETHRQMASDPAKGHLLFQWPDVRFTDDEIKNKTPREVKNLDVYFADVPGLQPGTDVELITAWNTGKEGDNYFHVWGMQAIEKDPSSVLRVPEVAQAAAAPVARAMHHAAHTTRRATHRTRTAGRRAMTTGRQTVHRTR